MHEAAGDKAKVFPRSLPRVVTISWFRNSSKDLKNFFARRDRLTYPKELMHHILVEGDSEDDTYEILKAEVKKRHATVLHKADFNSPQIKAFIHPGRARKLVKNAEFGIRTLLRDSDAEYVLWIESDLDYPPDLIERFVRTEKHLVAPMVLIQGTKSFYDTFAFRHGNDPRLKGPGGDPGCFQANYPYHPVYRESELFEVDAAGSCLFFHMDVIRAGAYFPPEDMIAGFCRTARERGFRVWVDPTTTVWHPTPNQILDWDEWQPWHDVKVLMKYQEKVPIDKAAFELGKPFLYAKPLEFAWVAQRLARDRGATTLFAEDGSTLPAYCSALGMDVTVVGSSVCEELQKQVVESSGLKFRFQNSPLTKLPFASESFEQVAVLGSLAFLQEDREAAAELMRVCKPKGKLFLTLPYDHLICWWDSCDQNNPARRYYDLQSVFDRFVTPLGAIVRDVTFMNYDIPKREKDPYFTHPNNAGWIALELEKPASKSSTQAS